MGKELNIQVTPLYQKIAAADTRFVINVGGTRSSKTFTLLQYFIIQALADDKSRVVSIVRKSFPSLKITAMRDFFDILKGLELYEEANHNKSDHTYILNNTLFEFISIQDAERRKGSKRNILFINECNELSYEDYFQLQIRTTERVYLDYNPSTTFWIDERLVGDVDSTLIRSTYLDNPFLPEEQVREIEKLKNTDEQYWKIYGLGIGAGDLKLIYSHEVIEEIPTNKIENGQITLVGLGMDFGFSQDPTTLVEVYKEGDHTLYFNELIYERGLTNTDIVQRLKGLGLDRYTEIIADSADPKAIEEIYRSKFNIKPAIKGPDSIINGIDVLKRFKLKVTAQSINLIKEFNNFKWIEDKNGHMLNKPAQGFDHAMDAIRYVALNKLRVNTKGQYKIRITGNTTIR